MNTTITKRFRFKIVTLLAIVTIACLWAWQYRPHAYASVTVGWIEEQWAIEPEYTLEPSFFQQFLAEHSDLLPALCSFGDISEANVDAATFCTEWLLRHVETETKDGETQVIVFGPAKHRGHYASLADTIGAEVIAMGGRRMSVREWIKNARGALQDEIDGMQDDDVDLPRRQAMLLMLNKALSESDESP